VGTFGIFYFFGMGEDESILQADAQGKQVLCFGVAFISCQRVCLGNSIFRKKDNGEPY